jgi:hypothetical protein
MFYFSHPIFATKALSHKVTAKLNKKTELSLALIAAKILLLFLYKAKDCSGKQETAPETLKRCNP